MPEPLTSQLVSELLRTLLVAFPRNLGAKDPAMMADVYRNGLSGLSGDAVRFAVDRSIKEDQYFPKVGRLREIGEAWQRRNAPPTPYAVRATVSERACAVCGAKPATVTITRVKRLAGRKFDWAPDTEGGSVVTDDRGRVVFEDVESQAEYIRHDPRAHGVFDRQPEDEVSWPA